MASYGFKENCVILAWLHHCSYYPTCCIARQIGDRQGMQSDKSSYHTLALAGRLLSRLSKTWPQRAMNKDIYFP